MCFIAIPGQNARIRAVRYDSSIAPQEPAPAVKTDSDLPRRRYPRTATDSWRCLESMSPAWIHELVSRRYVRTDSERGKGKRKVGHKPNWRDYMKY